MWYKKVNYNSLISVLWVGVYMIIYTKKENGLRIGLVIIIITIIVISDCQRNGIVSMIVYECVGKRSPRLRRSEMHRGVLKVK